MGDLVTESSFPLLLLPVLWVTGLQNLLLLFLLHPCLMPIPLITHSGLFIVSILWTQADHPNCSRHGDVTCDMWSHTLAVFCNGRSRLCFMKHFSRSLESSRERRLHVARDITIPRTVWMVRLCSDIHSGNTDTPGAHHLMGSCDTHFPKKKTLHCSIRQLYNPQFLYLYYYYFLNQELTFVYVHIVYAVSLMSYYRHVFLTLISLSSGFTKELSVIHILRWEFLENALCCFSHMFLSNYFSLSFQFLVAEHGSVQKEKLTEDYNDAYPLIFLSFLWIDNSLRLHGKKLPRERESPLQPSQL